MSSPTAAAGTVTIFPPPCKEYNSPLHLVQRVFISSSSISSPISLGPLSLSPVGSTSIEPTVRLAVGVSSLIASLEQFEVGGLASRLLVLSLPPALASSGVPIPSLNPLETTMEWLLILAFSSKVVRPPLVVGPREV